MGLKLSNILEPVNLKLLEILTTLEILNIKFTESTNDRKHSLRKSLYDTSVDRSSITFNVIFLLLIKGLFPPCILHDGVNCSSNVRLDTGKNLLP